MSWVAVVVGTIAVGTAAYSADKQRKGVHQQMDAAKAAQEQDAIDAAAAETNAATAANAKVAETKRRRLASDLGTGSGVDLLGGSSAAPTALAAGGIGAGAAPAGISAGRAVSYSAGSTALGAGAPVASPRGRPPSAKQQMLNGGLT
jgi:hypothetical protein